MTLKERAWQEPHCRSCVVRYILSLNLSKESMRLLVAMAARLAGKD